MSQQSYKCLVQVEDYVYETSIDSSNDRRIIWDALKIHRSMTESEIFKTLRFHAIS